MVAVATLQNYRTREAKERIRGNKRSLGRKIGVQEKKKLVELVKLRALRGSSETE